MVNIRHIQFHIFPAIAAVLVAAAFAFLSISSMFNIDVYADSHTTDIAEQYVDSFENHFSLSTVSTPEVCNSAFFVGFGNNGGLYSDPVIVYIPNCTTISVNNDVTTVSGYAYRRYGSNYSQGTSTISISTASPAFVMADGNSYNDLDYTPSNSSTPYVVCLSVPVSTDDVTIPYEGIRRAFVNPGSPGGVVAQLNGKNYSKLGGYTSTVKSLLSVGNPYNTTTVTTTTTTVSTTTATGPVTYPIVTNPPFELPSEWLGDYSESVPVPSVPPVTTVDVSGYDQILTDAENNFLSAIGFWFLSMKDFLSMNPTITYIAVFTIAIVLIILLLYNRGDDN